MRDIAGEAVQYLPQLRAFGLRLTRNEEDAADLVQEAILRFLMFGHRFQRGTNLRAYLFRITRNIFVDRVRRARTEQTVYDGFVGGGDDGAGAAWIVRNASSVLLQPILSEALEALPEPFMRTIVLADIQGMPLQRVASLMRCPVNTVKTRLFRGRRFLRTLVERVVRERGLNGDPQDL